MDKQRENMTLFSRIEKAMDSQYIQEHPDEVIELLVEVKAEFEKAAFDMQNLFAQLNVANDMVTMIRICTIYEFSEKLKEILDDFYHSDEDALLDTPDAIDNLVKEMVGEQYGK